MVADASTKKRPIAAASTAGTATINPSAKRKKSPLADQPQNYYAPSKPMTKEELSAWRKEQRRERNRQSAAASRDKTRARIEELEGEVARWRHMYDDLRRKMANMERHIEFLSKFHPGAGGVVPGQPRAPVYPLPPPQQQQMVTPPGSSPASPRTSPVGYAPYPQMTPTQGQNKIQPPVLPVVPALVPPPVKSSATSTVPPSHPSVTNPFPPLLSEPKHLVAMAVNGDTAETSCPNSVAIEEPKQHLIPISRQAVKITGANAFGSTSAMSVPPSSTPRNQDPLVECKRVETSSTPGFKPVEVATGREGVSAESGVGGAAAHDAESHATGGTFNTDVADGVDFRGSQPIQESSQDEDDAAFLDLLVDTLDGEFDPNLMI